MLISFYYSILLKNAEVFNIANNYTIQKKYPFWQHLMSRVRESHNVA